MARVGTFHVRPTRRVQLFGLAVIVVLVGITLILRPGVARASGACVYMGWTVYEDSNNGGDHVTVCSPTLLPVSASRSNFGVNPGNIGLHSGCNSTFGQSSTWNDCVSSATTVSLPTGFKFVLYADSGYGTAIFCTDNPGTHSYNLGAGNDLGSSARIITGSC